MNSFPVTFLLINQDTRLRDHLSGGPKGEKRQWATNPYSRRMFVWLRLLSVSASAASASISFPPFPCRGKNESLSQQLDSVIPQYRPGFHRRPAAEALRSDITSPLAFYGHVHCQLRKSSLMIISQIMNVLLLLVVSMFPNSFMHKKLPKMDCKFFVLLPSESLLHS